MLFRSEKEDGKYEIDHSEQVRFYSYATRLSLGYAPQKAVIHHLDTHRKDLVDISEQKLEETRSRIEGRVQRILDGDFNATPDEKKCRGCDFRSICEFKGFNVGHEFAQARSSRRPGSSKGGQDSLQSGENTPAGLGESVVSEGVRSRAKMLVGKVVQVDEKHFRVGSGSDPSKSYDVTELSCNCQGFRTYRRHHPELPQIGRAHV